MNKRILLVTRPIAPPWDEASKNFAFTLAKNLPDFEFGLLTNGIIEDIPDNIKQYPIYSSNNFNTWQKIELIMNLKRISCDFDIAHCLFTPTKFNSFLLSNLLSNKKIATIQTIATLREDLYSDDEIKKLMFADKIITYSKYAKEKLNNLGLNNIEQIYPGIDLSLYSPASKDTKLLTTYNLQRDDFIVTYPGEFIRLGATDDIVKAIIALCHSERSASGVEESNIRSLGYARDDTKNIKFIFACRVKNKQDQEKKEEIEKKFREKGLLDLIRLPGTFTTMEKVFNLSDVVIFPVRDMKGKFDAPLAVIEAMACGKPVIISNLPILSEFSNHENSVIIESGNAKQLLNAILDLCQNKEKRETIGKNARNTVEKNFDIKNISQKYKDVYKNI